MLAKTVGRQVIAMAAIALMAMAMGSTNAYGQAKGVMADTTKPVVSSTYPVDLDSNVYINKKIVATFNETMSAATITALTFTVTKGATPVAGTVTYDTIGTTAFFAPDSLLDTSAVYTATLTTGVTDTAGNPLDSDYVWTFSTDTMASPVLAPVILLSAGDYVILAKTGISTTAGTQIVGDIGVSPAAAGAITGPFALAMDPSGTFATSPLVTGNVYAADYTEPTPTDLGVAVLAMQAAYTDAATRPLPDYTELYTGDLSGKTLVPGLYKWGTGVLINGGVTLAGDSSDVWIFQIAQTLLVGSGAIVSLSGGAQPKNIFWQVAGQTTLGTTSQTKGIILDATAIVVMTGAALNGRALAQTAVTLDAATIGISGPLGVEHEISPGRTYAKLQLLPSRPNPASGPVRISYVLPRTGTVSLQVYDICGRMVSTLAQGRAQGGAYDLTWKGNDSQGRLLPAGVYFYQLTFDGASQTRRLVLLR